MVQVDVKPEWASEIPVIDLEQFSILPNVVTLIPREFAKENRLVLVNVAGEVLIVATSSPSARSALDRLPLKAGWTVEFVWAPEHEIDAAIERWYPSA